MDWARIESVFSAALGKAERDRRDFVRTACSNEVEAEEVFRLLAATTDDRVDAGLSGLRQMCLREGIAEPDQVPEGIGAYRIIRELGEGGTSRVFLAEHKDSGHKVALKVAGQRWLSEDARSLFAREAQILADLHDEHIARLHWDPSNEAEIPHIVTEYVDGLSIGRYCDENRLGVNERLELFLQVCAGVGYVHQNGVIHADLKPENLLVNHEGRAKIIDFGISKFRSSTGAALQRGAVAATPKYASPEQLAGQAIDAQSDIYSLGIVLFELLSGVYPLGGKSDHDRALQKKAHPGVLSRRARESGSKAAPLRRGFETPKKLARALKGHLDDIVAAALEVDREHRYLSVNDLASDIRAFLEGRRVSVSRATMRQVLSEHKLVAAALAVLMMLFGVGLAYQQYRIRGLEAETQRLTDMIGFFEGVFTPVDPIAYRNGELSAYGLLNRAGEQLCRLDGQQKTKAAVMVSLGEVYFHLDEVDRSGELFSGALEIIEEGEDEPRLRAFAQSALGAVRAAQGWHDEAEDLARRGLEAAEELGDEEAISISLGWYTMVKWERRDIDGAVRLVDRLLAMDLGQRNFFRDRATLLATDVLMNNGDHHRAKGLLTALIYEQERFPGGQVHPYIWETWLNLGHVSLRLGDASQARSAFHNANSALERLFGPNNAYRGWIRGNLGRCSLLEGDLDASMDYFQSAIDVANELDPTRRDFLVAETLIMAGDIHHRRNELGQLEAVAAELMEIGKRMEDRRYEGAALQARARAEMSRFNRAQDDEDLRNASAYLVQSLQAFEIHFGRDDPEMVSVLLDLGKIESYFGRRANAIDYLQRILIIAQRWPESVDPWFVESARSEIGSESGG